MQKTIFAILTNKKVRNVSAIETSLDKAFVAGAAWLPSKVL